MKLPPFLFTGLLILLFQPLKGQDRIQPHGAHVPATFQTIDRAFNQGQLSLDQKVLYKVYALQKPKALPASYRPQDALPIKCGTPAVIDYRTNHDQLSPAAKAEIQQLLRPRSLKQVQESYLSPSGHFSIQYETSGTDAVPPADENRNGTPDYVEEVAAAADSSYRHEVETLGYTNPINSGAIYEIHLLDLSFYGQTLVSNGGTIIQIENDFEGFPENTDPEGDQAGAIKATMAHEFKHAIQYAATEWSGETDLWAEMDATLMEEVVYDPVNDYYNYLDNQSSIFNSPEASFYPGSYYHVSWALYYEENYGPFFWPGVWEYIEADPEMSLVNAIGNQLPTGTTFTRSYSESHLWHYNSGNLATANYGFEEDEFYPTPTINHQLAGEDSLIQELTVPEFAANYLEFFPQTVREGFVRVDFTVAGDSTGVGLFARLADGTYDSRISIGGNQEAGIRSIETNWAWNDISRLGIIFANSSANDSTAYTVKVYPDIPEQLALVQNYPNPFSPQTTIEFNLPQQSEVQLKIYDVAGRLIRTLRNETLPAGYYEEVFDGSDLAAGIYFYQLITDNHTVVKKMTLIK